MGKQCLRQDNADDSMITETQANTHAECEEGSQGGDRSCAFRRLAKEIVTLCLLILDQDLARSDLCQ